MFSNHKANLFRTSELAEIDIYIILPYFWIPEDNLTIRVNRDHVPYDVWERKGYLQTTEGNVVHYGFIEHFIEKHGERFNIREIAFDHWGAVQMVQNLEGMGFTVVPFGQGFKDMSPPTKKLMKLVLEQKITHGGDCVAAVQIYNMLMDYKSSVTVKIDSIAASAASVIAMVGNKVLMSPVSMMMIHNPMTFAMGDTAEMQKAL